MTDTAVVISDQQIPFQDPLSNAAVLDYARALKPKTVIINGDFMDFPTLSTKFAARRADVGKLNDELAQGREYLSQLRQAVGRKAEIVFNEGNHEARWWTYVESQAAAFVPLTDEWLTVATALKLDKFDIRYRDGYYEGRALWERDGLVVTHGNWHGKSTHGKQHQAYYGSVLYGHLHRPGITSSTNYRGETHIAWSTGCLCNIEGPNMPPRKGTTPTSDSVQGFAVVHFGSRRYQVHLLDIIKHTVVGLNGREY